MTTRSRAELALIGVTIIWGTTFVIIKQALDETSTLAFIAARFIVASSALLLIFGPRLRHSPHLLRRRTTLYAGLLAGFCLFAGYFFQTLGLRYTTPSKSAFITGLTTALVPFFSAFVYRKAPHLSELIGVAVATAGMGLLTLTPDSLAISYGDAITLCCTVAFAFHILILGRYSPVSNFELLSVSQIVVTALLALSVCSWAEPFRFTMSAQVIAAVFLTGLFSTALGFTVQAWAQRHTTPTRAGLIFTLELISAVATSYVMTGERLTLRGAIGAVCILAGVLVAGLKPVGPKPHPSY